MAIDIPSVAAAAANNQTVSQAASDAAAQAVQSSNPLELSANIVSEQTINIRLPSPPLGSVVAKVVIENVSLGSAESEEEVTFDYIDRCTTPEKPPVVFVPGVSQGEIELAYDQCIDLVADLFCSPVTSSLDVPPEETPDPTVENFRVEKAELYPGDSTLLLFDLEGIGFYQIFQTAQGQTIKVVEDSFNIPERQTIKQTISIPPVVPQNIDEIQYSLVLKNKDGENISEQPRSQIVRIQRRIVPPAPIPRPQIKPDNDFGDAKKERYYLSSFVPGVIDTAEGFVVDKTVEEYRTTDLRVNSGSFVPQDLFRESIGSFYMADSSTQLVRAGNENQRKLLVFDPENIPTDPILNILPHHGTFGFLQENFSYVITSNQTEYEKDVLKVNALPRSKENAVLDVNYAYLKPYTEKEADMAGDEAYNSAIIKQHSEYNFYNRRYEEIHHNNIEILLPNMYFVAFNREGIDAKKTPTRNDDISIDPDIRKVVSFNESLPDYEQEPVDIKRYYDFYVKRNKQTTIQDQQLLNRLKHTYITYDSVNKIEQYNTNSEMHPMKVELSFTKPRYSFISKMIKDSDIKDNIMFRWLTKFQQGETETLTSVKEEFDGTQKSTFISNNRYIDITNKRQYGMGSGTNISSLNFQDELVFFGNYLDARETITGNNWHKGYLLRKEILKVVEQKARTYSEILQGKKCYRETLFYRIAKFDGDPVTSEPIQNIYLPNDPDKNSFKYIDTQVKYDKKYTYVIYTYDVVIANEYFSNSGIVDRQNNAERIKNYPKLLLIENIFDQIEAKVRDRPPVSPMVDIHSYKDNDSEVLMLLSKSSSTIKRKEVIIEDGDSEVFEEIRRAQNLSEEDLIEFSGDDTIKKYEVFRIERAPKSYEDFKGAKIAEIDTIIDPADPDKRSNSVSLKDRILPNKKYYYIFRCTDIHDQISNPTEVYEVKMINESGTVFLLRDIFKFEQQKDKQASKSFERFVMIKPDFLQESFEIDPGTSQNKEELKQKITTDVYSSQNTSIWNKKYKLRLVSKKTNKVYDINFKFGVETKIIE